jgi:predicted RNase H-like HicB family nuclease
VIFDNLVPYPALLSPENGVFSVRLLDFEGVEVQSTDFNEVMKLAQDALLRTLLRLMKETSGKLPSPDQFLESVDEAMIIMVDPLGGADYY